jgi:prophage regulatory protein
MEKLIPIRMVEDLTGFKKSSIYKRIDEGSFPPPVKIGASSRWVESEVGAWINAQIAGQSTLVGSAHAGTPSQGFVS